MNNFKYKYINRFVLHSLVLFSVSCLVYFYFFVFRPYSMLPNLENPVCWSNFMIKYDDMMMYEKGENSIMFSHLNHKNLFLNIRKIENELTVDSLVSFFAKKNIMF